MGSSEVVLRSKGIASSLSHDFQRSEYFPLEVKYNRCIEVAFLRIFSVNCGKYHCRVKFCAWPIHFTNLWMPAFHGIAVYGEAACLRKYDYLQCHSLDFLQLNWQLYVYVAPSSGN